MFRSTLSLAFEFVDAAVHLVHLSNQSLQAPFGFFSGGAVSRDLPARLGNLLLQPGQALSDKGDVAVDVLSLAFETSFMTFEVSFDAFKPFFWGHESL